MPIVATLPRPIWISPYYTNTLQYGDTPLTDQILNAIVEVEFESAPGVFDESVLNNELARVAPLGLPLLIDGRRPANSYLSQQFAWLVGRRFLTDPASSLQDGVQLALTLPEKPIVAYLDTPSEWPVARPSWITGRVWPSVQAFRNPAEGLGTFQTRIEGYLNRVAAYGVNIWLEPAFYTRNGAVPVAEIVECMPLYDAWLRVYPIVGMNPFADRRPTGMLDNPELKAWCQAFVAANPARPSYFDYWTPTSTPPPTSPIADGWYPQIAPSGNYLAVGNVRLSLARITGVTGSTVNLASITDVGEGIAPQWFNPGGAPSDQALYDNRHNALMVVPTPPPFVAQPLFGETFNAHGAGGGVWAAFTTAGGVQVKFSDGVSIPGRRMSIPAGPCVDQNGRAVYLSEDETQLFQRAGGIETLLDSAALITRPHCSTQGVVWSRLESGTYRTYGSLGGGPVTLVHASSGSEFSSVVIDTPTGPWILSWAGNLLILRRWGTTAITVIPTGGVEPFHPHGVFSATLGGFLLAWNSPAGVLGLTFLPLAGSPPVVVPPPTTPPTVPPSPPPPGGGTPGVPTPPAPPPGVPVPGTPAGTLTVIPAVRPVLTRKAIYPHVTQITDQNAQQSVKLLWDRMHDLAERLSTGDIAKRFEGFDASLARTTARLDSQADQLEQVPAESFPTSIPGGIPQPPGPPSPPGTSGTCADSPGTGHFDPGGALTEERARKITCGTGDEFSSLRVATATLAERENNAEILILRIIWHLQLGGYNAGRQQNPSTAISKDKIAIVLGTETRAFDIFSAYDDNTQSLHQKWDEVFPAVLVASAGVAD